jgi:chemotaxis protein CheC
MIHDVRELRPLQLDALREVANIGAGHAATALSQLTNRRIWVDVPQIRVSPLEEVPDLLCRADDLVATVVMQVLGDLAGRTIQVFPGATAARLASILLNRPEAAFPDGFGEMEKSAIKEAGNILASAYLTALSDFLGLMLLTSIPALSLDHASATLTGGTLDGTEGTEYVFCIDTLFKMNEQEVPVSGHFLLVPDAASLPLILRAIRLA